MKNAINSSSYSAVLLLRNLDCSPPSPAHRRHDVFSNAACVTCLCAQTLCPRVPTTLSPRLEAYLQRLCSLLYMGPLHPSSAHLAHLLQDFLGTSPRVETLGRLQRSRPERELRQALQVCSLLDAKRLLIVDV